jgi:pilus assembly protein Flp/PilA
LWLFVAYFDKGSGLGISLAFTRSPESFQLSQSEGVKVMFSRFAQAFVNFLKTEEGPTAVEYAVMLALIIVICLAAITALGTSANETFGNVSSAVGAS